MKKILMLALFCPALALAAVETDLMTCSKKDGAVMMKLENVPAEGFFCSAFEKESKKKFQNSMKGIFKNVEYNGRRPTDVKVLVGKETIFDCSKKDPDANCQGLYKTASIQAEWRGHRGSKHRLSYGHGVVQFIQEVAGKKRKVLYCEPPKSNELSCPAI